MFDFLAGLFGGEGGADERSTDTPASADRSRDSATTEASGRGDGESSGDLEPAAFREHAEEFAEREDEADLDFTLDSLRALDEDAEGQSEILGILGEEIEEGDELLSKMHGGYTLEWGSYFGEVLVREFDGEWVEDDGWAVAVPVADGAVEVTVFDVAAAAAGGEPQFHDVGTDLASELAAAEDRAASGGGPPSAAADGEVTPADAADDEMGPAYFADQTEELIEFWGEYDLDFSPDSLVRVEALIETHYGGDHFADAEFGEEDHVRSLSLTGFTMQFGSYFGEVLIREFGGEWVDDDGWHLAVDADPAPVSVAVFAVAHDSLVEEPELVTAYERVEAQAESAVGYGVAPDVETAAGEFADSCPDHDLDFTPESLARLDDLVDAEWGNERFRGATLGGDSEEDLRYTQLVVGLGSYYGEVLGRSLDAGWTYDGGMGFAVDVTGPDDTTLTANVFHIAEDCLTEPSKFAFQYDVITDHLELDVPQVSDGTGEVYAVDQNEADAGGDETSAGETSVEAMLAGLDDDAADFVESWPDYDLDYSPPSLIRVDRLVREEFADYDFTDVELGDESDGDSLFLTAHAMDAGAYFTAVLERHLDAEWVDDEDGLSLVVDGADAYAQVDPFGIAAKCFRGDDSFAASYEAVRGQLSIDAPPVEE